MSTPVRGACPSLAAPMQTGDGLLARIVPRGPIAIDAFAALCAAAGTHGNGLMEITGRGSLQIRGLSSQSAPHFAAAAKALGIGNDGAVPVLANPLPQEPSAPIQSSKLAAQVGAAIAARDFVSAPRALAPKVSVVVDDGGQVPLDHLTADIRLRAVRQDGAARLLVLLGGDGACGTPLGTAAPEDAARLVCDLLEVLAVRGHTARARDVLSREGLAPFLTATHITLGSAPPRPAVRPPDAIGLHRLYNGNCAIGVALAFGQAQALDLVALLRIARANGANWVATAPQRALLIGPIGEMTAFALGTAADTLGFVVDARDARRRVVACPGAPLCASGLIPARALAAEIATRLPQGDLAVHVSGCTKGCAHQGPAPLTIVGTDQTAAFVRGGTPQDVPDRSVRASDVAAEAVHMIVQENADA